MQRAAAPILRPPPDRSGVARAANGRDPRRPTSTNWTTGSLISRGAGLRADAARYTALRLTMTPIAAARLRAHDRRNARAFGGAACRRTAGRAAARGHAPPTQPAPPHRRHGAHRPPARTVRLDVRLAPASTRAARSPIRSACAPTSSRAAAGASTSAPTSIRSAASASRSASVRRSSAPRAARRPIPKTRPRPTIPPSRPASRRWCRRCR